MFLRVARRIVAPGFAAGRQWQRPVRCFCSSSTVEGDETLSHGNTRFHAGKAKLVEMFPGTGVPKGQDNHAARTQFYSALAAWATEKQREPSEIVDILHALPSRLYPPFAEFVHKEKLVSTMSLDDVASLIRKHPRHNAAPTSLPLLKDCVDRLAKESGKVVTLDAALILMSLSYMGNVENGRLLGLFTNIILNDCDGIPLKMLANVVEMLARKRLLDRRFSSGILKHIETHADDMTLPDLTTCCSSFSFARLLTNHHSLLKVLDRRVATEAEELSDSALGSVVTLFRVNNFLAKHCTEKLKARLASPEKEASCSVRTFANVANYMCLSLQVTDENILEGIRNGIVTRKSFDPRELMLLVATLSRLRLVSYDAGSSTLDDIVAVLEDHIPNLHAAQLVSLLLELRKIEVLSTKLVEAILQRAMETSDDMKVEDAVRLIHAAARCIRKDNPALAIKLLWKVAPQISKQVPHMEPRMLSMTSMAMNMLGVRHPLLCTNIAERGYKMLLARGADIDTISSIASSLSRVDFPAVDFFVELHKYLENNLFQASSQKQLVRLAWACVAQGVVPRRTLKQRVFSIDTAPTGDEELSHLQMLRDLFIVSVYDGIFKIPAESDVLKQLFSSISAKQMQYDVKPKFVSTLVDILGEDAIIVSGVTVESISVPAAILFDESDGSPMPWSSIGVKPGARLPQPRLLKGKPVRAVALIQPSIIYPEKSPSGQTKLMCRILRMSGWHPTLVPEHQWSALSDESAKLDLLKEILMDTLTRPETEAAEGDSPSSSSSS